MMGMSAGTTGRDLHEEMAEGVTRIVIVRTIGLLHETERGVARHITAVLQIGMLYSRESPLE